MNSNGQQDIKFKINNNQISENILKAFRNLSLNKTDTLPKENINFNYLNSDPYSYYAYSLISDKRINEELNFIFERNPSLKKTWDKLPEHHRKQFILWISTSKEENELQEKLSKFIKIFSERLSNTNIK